MHKLLHGVACAALFAFPLLGCARSDVASQGDLQRAVSTAAPAASTTTDRAFRASQLLEQFASSNRFRTGRPANFTWLPDSSAVLYTRTRSETERTQDLFVFDVARNAERVLLTSDDILGGSAEKLTPEEAARRERMRLTARGIARFSLSKDGTKLLVPLSGSVFVVDVAHALRGLPQESPLRIERAIDAKFSPDVSRIAFVREGEVFVRMLAGEFAPGVVEMQASTGATLASGGTIGNGEAEFVAQEEMSRTEGFWWSPDGQAILYQQSDTKGVQTFTIADAGDPAKPAQENPYPRAGQPNVDVRLFIASLPGSGASGQAGTPVQTEVSWDRAKFPYVARVAWGRSTTMPASADLRVLVQDRLQREQRLLRVDVATGSTQSVLSEQDNAWINLHDADPQWRSSEAELWWLREAERGWEALLLGPEGNTLATLPASELTPGGARAVLGTSNDGQSLWISVGTAPTQASTWRIDRVLKDGVQSLLARPVASDISSPHRRVITTTTPSPDGTMGVTYVAGGGQRQRWFVQRFPSSPSEPATTLSEVQSLHQDPAIVPNVELLSLPTGNADASSFEVAIIRPTHFDARKKYPVLNFVYAGPGVTIVSADTRRYTLEQWYAEQGFIVVSIDGRGTPGKGRTWERAIAGNLIDVAMQDQVLAMRLLCERYSELDAGRMGVYGWSFGGYFSLLAPSLAPQTFKAAAAGAPVSDWRDYDTHYTERYMGIPAALSDADPSAPHALAGLNTQGYDASSALTHAKDVRSPLMILHGTADDNVYFVHALRMADALTRAGVRYEFVPLLGQTHGVSGPQLIQRMHEQIADFFIRHLK
jgi:dipeptidyl-peptidase-4